MASTDDAIGTALTRRGYVADAATIALIKRLIGEPTTPALEWWEWDGETPIGDATPAQVRARLDVGNRRVYLVGPNHDEPAYLQPVDDATDLESAAATFVDELTQSSWRTAVEAATLRIAGEENLPKFSDDAAYAERLRLAEAELEQLRRRVRPTPGGFPSARH